MIKGLLFNEEDTCGLNETLLKGINWLKENDLSNLNDGRYNIDGDKVFVNVQSYETKLKAQFEAHRKYIDIQYMIKGEEKIGIAKYSDCFPVTPYDTDKDIEFLTCDDNDNYYILREGEFLIFYPEDAHQPSLAIDTQKLVKKAVIKVFI